MARLMNELMELPIPVILVLWVLSQLTLIATQGTASAIIAAVLAKAFLVLLVLKTTIAFLYGR